MDFRALLHVAGRWRDALVDPTRRDRTVLVSLAIYVLLWTVYGTIAKSSQGLHPDMTEVIAWSRDLSLGQLKHPPFAAWLVRLWFTVFPIAGWSYYLLAMLMPAVALWIVWRMSADYLDADKRIVGIALLTFVPFFNFHALKFNVNTVLLPLWAATTLFFLMSVRTRGPYWAMLAGVAAACAMLGKYWSIFLLAGLVHRRADRPPPGALFSLRGAVDHVVAAVLIVHRAASALALSESTLSRSPMRWSFTATSRSAPPLQRARLCRRLVRLCGDPGDLAVLVAVRANRATVTDMLWPAGLRPPSCWRPRSGRPLLLPARLPRSQRHRDYLAVVDVGLDAVAGAAAVAARSGHFATLDTRRILARRCRRSRSSC